MRDMSKLFGLPESLFNAIKEVQKEETEYQQKVRAHMEKRGIKSLGELTPEQKKTFFKEVDALHQAKNEEVEITEGYEKVVLDFLKKHNVDAHFKSGKLVIDKEDMAAAKKVLAKAVGFDAKDLEIVAEEVEIKEESGSGTLIAKASAQKKRAEISQKIADAKTKHDRELANLRKQKTSVGEEVEQVDEEGRIIKGKGYDNPENERKAPEGKLDITSLIPGYNERAARFFGVQAKGRLVKGKAQSAPQKEEVEGVAEGSKRPNFGAGIGDIHIVYMDGKHKRKFKREDDAIDYADDLYSRTGNETIEVQNSEGGVVYSFLDEQQGVAEGKSGTGYELYHKDFSSAMAHAYDFAKQKYGIEIDPMEIDRNVAMGPKKPSSGKANAYRLLDKTGKKAIQVQVTNLDNKRYELNMYKEEFLFSADELAEEFSPAMIAKLKDEYGKIGTIDPSGESYKKLVAMLDKLDKKDLQTLADAGIKFVSGLARNRVNRMNTKKEETDIQEVSQETLRSYFDKAVTDLSKRKIKKNTGQGDAHNDKKIADRKKGLSVASSKIAAKMDEESGIPEYKTGGESLANKFEKAMAKMGVKAKIKMKTVNNVSVNEAAIDKVRKAAKKMKEDAPSSKEGSTKSGEKLSGKKEPIEINPEIAEK